MSAVIAERSSSTALRPIIVFGVMGFVLALRVAHLC
jgi:hypothetical protein